MNFSETIQNAKSFYDQLSPQQRQAVAQQFKQHFGASSDPQLQQQAQSLDSPTPDSEQLSQLHNQAMQTDPGTLNRALDHPDVQDALSQSGATGNGSGEERGQQGGDQYSGQQGGDQYSGQQDGDEDRP